MDTILLHQDNRANDKTIWGARIKDGKQIGQNKLGETWMKIRDEVFNKQSSKPVKLTKPVPVETDDTTTDDTTTDEESEKKPEKPKPEKKKELEKKKEPEKKKESEKKPEKPKPEKQEKKELDRNDFTEGDTVIWVDSKGNQEGKIVKKNPKTAEIKSIKGENKRVPYKKLSFK